MIVIDTQHRCHCCCCCHRRRRRRRQLLNLFFIIRNDSTFISLHRAHSLSLTHSLSHSFVYLQWSSTNHNKIPKLFTIHGQQQWILVCFLIVRLVHMHKHTHVTFMLTCGITNCNLQFERATEEILTFILGTTLTIKILNTATTITTAAAAAVEKMCTNSLERHIACPIHTSHSWWWFSYLSCT